MSFDTGRSFLFPLRSLVLDPKASSVFSDPPSFWQRPLSRTFETFIVSPVFCSVKGFRELIFRFGQLAAPAHSLSRSSCRWLPIRWAALVPFAHNPQKWQWRFLLFLVICYFCKTVYCLRAGCFISNEPWLYPSSFVCQGDWRESKLIVRPFNFIPLYAV